MSKINKITLKISIFLISSFGAFGLFSAVANALPTITTTSATTITYSTATLRGTLNEGSLPVNAWFEFGTDASHLAYTTNPVYYESLSNSFSANLTGLTNNTTYYFRAVAENNQGRSYGNILYFTTTYYVPTYYEQNTDYYSSTQPGIATNSAYNITSTSAIFGGFVNGGGLGTNAWFEYGTDSKNLEKSTTQDYYGTGSKSMNITITSLLPNTVYYFRAVAQNTKGRVFGNTFSFKTAGYTYPTNNQVPNTTGTSFSAKTTPATNVSASSAQLNGLIINEVSMPSNTYFEWGTTSALGNKTKIISTGPLPAIRHANVLTGLSSNTIYYFRVVAENNNTRINGETTYFITNKIKTVYLDKNTDTNIQSNTNTPITNTNQNQPIINQNIENTPTITPVSQNPNINLGANAISSGFLPNNLFGWLLLAIFILLLILLVQHLLFPSVTTIDNHNHH